MFLCTKCKKALCPDCREIEAEYEELLANYKRENYKLSQQVETLQNELGAEKRRSASFERVAKLGHPDVIKEWMDTLAK